MFSLLQLFLKLSAFLVFLVLEIICFSLVVKYNQRQQTVYANSVNKLTAWMQGSATATRQYFSLEEENRRLARENSMLQEHLYNLKIDTSRLDTAFTTDSLPQPKYSFISAKILKNSINQNHNYLVLDKGGKEGIAEHSGVLGANGVVGVVRKVSPNFSVVMSILHRQTRISARIRNRNFFGSLVWKGTDTRLFNLEDIPKHALLSKGDTVETSGYSAIFPPGIMIGRIEDFGIEPGSNFYTLTVRSEQDMSNIQHVYVVKNILRKEQEDIEQAVLQEDQ